MNTSLIKFAPGSEGMLAPFKKWLDDDSVNEILINRPKEVWIEDKRGMNLVNCDFIDKKYLNRLFMLLSNENKQNLNSNMPFLSGELYDGSRIQLVIPPAARDFTLSIRKKSLKRFTLDDYEEQGFFKNTRLFDINDTSNDSGESSENTELKKLYYDRDIKNFIRQSIEYKKVIVLSGETSSGKTTFLNSCANLIPKNERIITLEDTLEVDLPHKNQVNLKSPPNSSILMSDLIKASLRLRPDRLIVGEIRGKEILDFISACSTGHDGSIATIHASNPRIAIQRMVQLYKQNNVPAMSDTEIRDEIFSVIDCIIQLHRDPTEGREVKYISFPGGEK